jgi:DNA-binding transcriptional LysR family regulator
MIFFVAQEDTMQEIVGASLQDITAFVAVAQTASFTRAAEDLGTNKSNVGKAVQRLEAHLGTRLFQRTTRAVRLTEDGESYLQAALVALDGLREAEQALAARRAEPVGRVRVDLPAGFGRLLLPTLGALRERYPKLVLELALTDRMSDPVAEGWDIIVRIGVLPSDSELTVRKLCDLKLGLYASPDYLARRGAVHAISDLTAHDAVVFRGPSGRLRAWPVLDNGEEREFKPDADLILADGQALVEAVILGLGVSQILDRVAQPYVKAGKLVHLLPEADVPGPPVNAIIPLGQKMTAKTRAVLNHLVDSLRA